PGRPDPPDRDGPIGPLEARSRATSQPHDRNPHALRRGRGQAPRAFAGGCVTDNDSPPWRARPAALLGHGRETGPLLTTEGLLFSLRGDLRSADGARSGDRAPTRV